MSKGELKRPRSGKVLLVIVRTLDFILSMKGRPWRVLIFVFKNHSGSCVKD